MALGDTQYILNKLTAQNGINLIQDNISVTEGLVSGLINQWDEQWDNCYWDLTASGQKIANVLQIGCRSHIKVSPSTSYYFKVGGDKLRYILFYDTNKTFISYVAAIGAICEFTTPSNCVYLTFYMTSDYGSVYLNDISINYPSSYTGYYSSKLPRTNAHIGDLGNVIANGMFNQLVQNGNFASTDIWSSTQGTISVSGNVMTFTPTVFNASVAINGNILGTIQNHIYYTKVDIKYNNKLPSTNVFVGSGGYDGIAKSVTDINKWVTLDGVFTRGTGGSDKFSIYPRTANWVSGDTVSLKNAMCIDLTAMFGSGNEPSSVEDFRALFPDDYYSYCPSKLGFLGNAMGNGRFNLLVLNGDFATDSIWTTVDATKIISGGQATILVSAVRGGLVQTIANLISGHKYLLAQTLKATTNNTTILSQLTAAGSNVIASYNSIGTSWQTVYAIGEASSTTYGIVYIKDNRSSDWDNIYCKACMVIDLTAMFGIGNEPTTIEDFKSMFPASYYPYNSGLDEKTGATDTSSKIYLVGTTSQVAEAKTYSDNEVFVTDGVLQAKSVNIAGGCTLLYDSTNKCINFIFN